MNTPNKPYTKPFMGNISPDTSHTQPTILKDFLPDFSIWLESKGLKPLTIKSYVYYMDHLKYPLEQLDVDRFLARKKNSIPRAFLRNVREFLIKRKNDMSARDIDIPKVTGKKGFKIPEVLSVQEINNIANHTKNERDKLMLMLTFNCGLRLNELTHLKPLDFKWVPWIEKRNIAKETNADMPPCEVKFVGKFDKERLAFIPDDIAFKLNAYTRSLKLTRENIDKPLFRIGNRRFQQILAEASKIALGEAVNPHRLRHSYATFLMQQGFGIEEVKELLGHASIATTQIYLHVDKTALKEKLSGLYNGSKIVQ